MLGHWEEGEGRSVGPGEGSTPPSSQLPSFFFGNKILKFTRFLLKLTLLCSLDGKESACNAGDPGPIAGSGRFPGEVKRLPWTEKPGGLQTTGSHRVGHDRATNAFLHFFHFAV